LTTTVREFEPRVIHQRIGELIELYRQVYAEPPYYETAGDAAAFGERLLNETTKPGFAMVMNEDDGTILGFAHGYTFTEEQWWTGADTIPAEVVGQTKFAVMELVVRRGHRGHGYASMLIHELLRKRPEPYATLCTNPLAPARAIYHHWGWRHVGNTPQRPTFPAMHILTLHLEQHRTP
jgi:GNAT superfamily N-acetyltransferase